MEHRVFSKKKKEDGKREGNEQRELGEAYLQRSAFRNKKFAGDNLYPTGFTSIRVTEFKLEYRTTIETTTRFPSPRLFLFFQTVNLIFMYMLARARSRASLPPRMIGFRG